MPAVNHPKENKHIIALLLKYDLDRVLFNTFPLQKYIGLEEL